MGGIGHPLVLFLYDVTVLPSDLHRRISHYDITRQLPLTRTYQQCIKKLASYLVFSSIRLRSCFDAHLLPSDWPTVRRLRIKASCSAANTHCALKNSGYNSTSRQTLKKPNYKNGRWDEKSFQRLRLGRKRKGGQQRAGSHLEGMQGRERHSRGKITNFSKL